MNNTAMAQQRADSQWRKKERSITQPFPSFALPRVQFRLNEYDAVCAKNC